MLLLFIALGEYWSLTHFVNQLAFVFTTQFLLLPLYGLLIALHMHREESLRVFELNLVGDWDSYLLSRLFVSALGLLPLVAVSYVAVFAAHQPSLVAYVALWVLCFLSVASLGSLSKSLGVFLVILVTYSILLPVALASVYQEYSAMGGLPPATLDYLAFFTAPLMAHYYAVGGLMAIGNMNGALVSLAMCSVMLLAYFFIGRSVELNP
jgi:hypothetical protein